MFDFAAKYDAGMTYQDFLEHHGTVDQRRRWTEQLQRITFSESQLSLIRSFTRQMAVVCLAGAWCGDCVEQCPIFQRIEEANPLVTVRYYDRDTHPDLGAELSVCGGARVPVVVWLSEDFQPVGRMGDRTLSKYRRLAQTQLGPACSTGIVPPDQELMATVIGEWLNEFERCQLILRLSPRLRQKHGD